jgi:hypothetical protein
VKSAELWFHQAGDPLELGVTENLDQKLDQETVPIFLGQATESKKLTNTVQYYSFLVLK